MMNLRRTVKVSSVKLGRLQDVFRYFGLRNLSAHRPKFARTEIKIEWSCEIFGIRLKSRPLDESVDSKHCLCVISVLSKRFSPFP